MVFQEPDDQLFIPTVLEDASFGLVARGMNADAARTKAASCLERLGASRLRDRPPHRMSGGEKRIAALAGILVMEPLIIMLDEPTSSLDPRARRDVAALLKNLGASMIMSTHDMALALNVCDRAIVMQKGRVKTEGPTAKILYDEETLRTYGL